MADYNASSTEAHNIARGGWRIPRYRAQKHTILRGEGGRLQGIEHRSTQHLKEGLSDPILRVEIGPKGCRNDPKAWSPLILFKVIHFKFYLFLVLFQ